MDEQRTQQGKSPNTKTAQAPAEPIRPPEVNRVEPRGGSPDAGSGDRQGQDPTRRHPGSPQTPK